MSGITEGTWETARGGRSVNAGQLGKIRMEPGVSLEEIRANMRLIAAAPDLLVACKDYVRDVRKGVQGNGVTLCKAIDAAEKAEGVRP